MKEYKPEILIYLNHVRTYFKTNVEAFKYLMIEVNPELFYAKLCDISEKNFEENGDPHLTITQFEQLKEVMITLLPAPKTFEKIPNYGIYSLN